VSALSPAAVLWKDNAELAAACLRPPFVQGIALGDLPRDRFVFYVEQDAFFLDGFARAYALALAKAPDREAMAEIRVLLEGVDDELRLHQSYAQRWGARLDPEPAAATLAYTDFLLRVAWSEPVGHILAAMTPCMRLYAHLGQGLEAHTAADSPYREWVTTYADEDFERWRSGWRRCWTPTTTAATPSRSTTTGPCCSSTASSTKRDRRLDAAGDVRAKNRQLSAPSPPRTLAELQCQAAEPWLAWPALEIRRRVWRYEDLAAAVDAGAGLLAGRGVAPAAGPRTAQETAGFRHLWLPWPRTESRWGG
jgi:thiaminase (transcriptional activator TenA)